MDFNENKGFSLVEIMVVVVIMSILAIGSAQMFSSQVKLQKFVRNSMERNSLHSLLEVNLRNDQACLNTFAALGALPSIGGQKNLTAIKDLSNNNLIQSNSPFGEIETEQIVVINDSVALGGSGLIRVRIPVKQRSGQSNLQALIPVERIQMVTADASGLITSCDSGSASTPVSGTASVAAGTRTSSYNNHRVTFISPFSAPPQQVLITPKWGRNTSDEGTDWWVTDVDATGFTIRWYGPSSGGTTRGENDVYWLVIP